MDAEFVLIMASCVATIIFLFMIMIAQSQQQDKQIRGKVTKLLTNAGGTEIEITSIREGYGSQGVCNYAVNYKDKRGYTQERRLTHLVGFWGRLHGDIRWDKPLNVVSHELHPSKEQIISEMDAEIKRLRGALAAAGSQDSVRYTK